MKKKRAERGIFLSEAMFSVLILSTVMLLSFPILIHTYRERLILQQKAEAVSVLRYHLSQWESGDQTFDPPNVHTAFTLEWVKKNDREADLCVRWSEASRDEKLCGEARK
ncbi:type II secretion system protein [Sporolactobacillus sp. THM7-7]|nr:type II secretion system protein [Sporolactobacillus sp. THM7-7]